MKFPSRYLACLLIALGMAVIYGLRVNINYAMIAMVNKTAVAKNRSASLCGNVTKTYVDPADEGQFVWSDQIQGYILSSYYWGYIVMMFPGARMCEIFSVKWMWFAGVSLNIVGSLLMPLGANTHYGFAIGLRVLQGLGASIGFPATALLLASWAPASEKNTLGSIVFAGTVLGTAIGILVTGLILLYLNWEAVFYIMGAASIPWLGLWYLFVGDTPEKTRFISQKEIDYILTSQGEKAGTKKKIKIHWKNIFTSKPFWGLIIAQTCSNWNFYLLLTDLPIYLDKVFALSQKNVTIYMCIGYVSNWAFSVSVGATLDRLRKKGKISQTWAKKIATLLGSAPIAVFMIVLAYSGCNAVLGVIFVILCLMFFGAMWVGFMSNHGDIGPKVAATLMGIANTTGTLSGIAVPVFVGYLVGKEGTDTVAWKIIFWVAVGFFVVEIVFYTLWASGEPQNYYTEIEVEPEASKEN